MLVYSKLRHINNSRCKRPAAAPRCGGSGGSSVGAAPAAVAQSHPNTWPMNYLLLYSDCKARSILSCVVCVATIKWSEFLNWFLKQYYWMKTLILLPDDTFMLIYIKTLAGKPVCGIISKLAFKCGLLLLSNKKISLIFITVFYWFIFSYFLIYPKVICSLLTNALNFFLYFLSIAKIFWKKYI